MSTPPLGPAFTRLLVASGFANLADGVRSVTLPLVAATLTRDPLVFSAVAVAGSLPWLVLSLPAGVIVDRIERRSLLVAANVVRTLLLVALMLAIVAGRAGIVLLVLVALGLGTAEVVFDNAAQTLLPALVPSTGIERANGRLAGMEIVANQFAGPPLGGALFAVAVALPVALDAGMIAGAGLLVLGLPRGLTPAPSRGDRPEGAGCGAAAGASAPASAPVATGFVAELREGVAWLARHRLLRTLALLLAVLNGTGAMGSATFALFATGEGSVLGLGPFGFSVLLALGSAGALVASLVADRVVVAFGRAGPLWAALVVFAVAPLAIALAEGPVVVGFAFAATAGMGVVWNVITVSLRQTVIPDHLLGRVNSSYRFLGWGAMPIGATIGGLVARVGGLRAPWFLAAALTALALPFALRDVRSSSIEAARAAALPDGPA